MTKIKPASLLAFIALTFIGTFAIEFWLIAQGIRFDTEVIQYTPLGWLFLTMWMPGLAAIIATKFIEGLSFAELKESLFLRVGSIGPYLLTFLIAPTTFASMYGLSWAFGWATPDWTMEALMQASGGDASITPEAVFQQMLPLSIVIGPLMHFPLALGEEIGWRGYLLPRLMVLGKAKAYAITGILWGLWHAPIIWVGFNYPGNPIAGIALMCVLTSAFGLFLNEMVLHYRSTYLAAFIHAAINAQGFGIWMWLFPSTDPFLAGGTGFTAIVIWIAVGLLTMRILPRLKEDSQQP